MTIKLKLIIFTFLIVFIPILFFSFFISTMVVNELYSSMTDKMKNNLKGISLDLERMKEELLFSIERISTNDLLIENAARLRTGIILTAFCTAFLAALSALIFVNYINKPILELTNATKKISSGDLKTRVRIISRDEIGDLGISFNDMARQLDMNFKKIESQVEELKANEKKNRDPEIDFKTVFDNAHDAYFIHDLDGRILDVNQTMLDIYGIDKEQAMEFTIAEDFSSTDNPLDQLPEIWKKVVSGEPQHFEWITKKPNTGTYFPVDVHLNKIVFTGKEVILATVRDISRRKKAEEQLIQSQKMETVGTLAGGLAHDFNNILVGILGTISMIDHRLRKEGIIEKEKLEEYLQIMKNSGERATAIIQQLLTLSRKQELSLALTDLSMVIKNVMKIGENSFDKSVKLNPVYLKHPAIVNANPTQIEQVLLNLCVNAVHAMTIMRKKDENWGGELTVTINKSHSDEYFRKVHPHLKEGEYWALSVEDTGVGMDHDTLSRIFDPFFTMKGKGKGTGFGLSIAYNIVKQHQGTIDVYSKIGDGTNFRVFLPVLK
jgi:PAS domain S-box-containing protein